MKDKISFTFGGRNCGRTLKKILQESLENTVGLNESLSNTLENEIKKAIEQHDLLLRPYMLVIHPNCLKALGEGAKEELEKYCVVVEENMIDENHPLIINRKSLTGIC